MVLVKIPVNKKSDGYKILDVTNGSTYTLKMATWVDETCWWSICNERNS